jgi:MFS family permease
VISTPEPGRPSGEPPESLADLLGGRRGAVDATVPPVAFAIGWLAAGLWGGVVAAVLAGTAVAGWRWRRGDRPRSVLIGLLAVCVAALVALRTGRATDFFLLQLVSNAASALAWMVSIVVRWPLLGVLVGVALGQRGRWRRDPALLRAYGRGSWVWAATYLLRLAVFVPLWLGGQVVVLVVARVALTWPLVAAALAVSWLVIRRSLPADHPGLRHPVTPSDADATAAN